MEGSVRRVSEYIDPRLESGLRSLSFKAGVERARQALKERDSAREPRKTKPRHLAAAQEPGHGSDESKPELVDTGESLSPGKLANDPAKIGRPALREEVLRPPETEGDIVA